MLVCASRNLFFYSFEHPVVGDSINFVILRVPSLKELGLTNVVPERVFIGIGELVRQEKRLRQITACIYKAQQMIYRLLNIVIIERYNSKSYDVSHIDKGI